MRKAEQPLAPGADKLAVAIEDDDRVRLVAIETVNTVFRIDRDRARFHVEPFGRALPIFVHLVGVFAAADDRIHWRSPLFYGCQTLACAAPQSHSIWKIRAAVSPRIARLSARVSGVASTTAQGSRSPMPKG